MAGENREQWFLDPWCWKRSLIQNLGLEHFYAAFGLGCSRNLRTSSARALGISEDNTSKIVLSQWILLTGYSRCNMAYQRNAHSEESKNYFAGSEGTTSGGWNGRLTLRPLPAPNQHGRGERYTGSPDTWILTGGSTSRVSLQAALLTWAPCIYCGRSQMWWRMGR